MSNTSRVCAESIGVFDSGVGGLSVLTELVRLMPHEDFVFLADEAYLPYGDKPQHEIAERVQQVGDYFHELPCKALVIACNTATAAGATALRNTYPDWPIVGIEPAVKPAALMTRSGRVGILATINTVASERFKNLVQRFDEVATVYARPCPGLVELIEQHPMNPVAVRSLLGPHIQALLALQVDVIVLGCTHYPFVSAIIRELAGPGVQILDTGQPVAKHAMDKLQAAGLLSHSDQAGSVKFLTSGDLPSAFSDRIRGLAGQVWPDPEVSQVALRPS